MGDLSDSTELYPYLTEIVRSAHVNFCHEGNDSLTFLFAVVFRWSSYLATTVRSAPMVSLHNATLATAIQGTFS